jgi:hypothetical protein
MAKGIPADLSGPWQPSVLDHRERSDSTKRNGTLTFDTRFLASRAVAGTYAMWGNNGLGRRATELTSSQAPAGILDVRRKPAQSSQF